MGRICKTKSNVIIVRLCGDLDHHVTEQIRNEIDETVESKGIKNIAFDFKNVNFMDSSGIGLIMGRYKRIKPMGGEIFVCNLNCQMQRIFGLFGLDGITKRSNKIDVMVNEED